jgi:hypothetical protein
MAQGALLPVAETQGLSVNLGVGNSSWPGPEVPVPRISRHRACGVEATDESGDPVGEGLGEEAVVQGPETPTDRALRRQVDPDRFAPGERTNGHGRAMDLRPRSSSGRENPEPSLDAVSHSASPDPWFA